jgi:competence protein ComEC
MSTIAKNILIPQSGVLRIAFLYVGQGDAIIMTVPNGTGFEYVLIDTNIDEKNGGIDVKALLSDLTDKGDKLTFINTHPHADHTEGIKAIHEKSPVTEVWHSGHKPGKGDDCAYQEMMDVIKAIGKENEFVLFGTNDSNKVRKADKVTEIIKKLGDIDYVVLSPAEYVADEVDGEDAATRYNRIHERSGVLKISYGGSNLKHVMITGDSDKKAWREHITDYHKAKLPCDVLSASHHGSRTFFKDSGDDEDVYETHIETMKPKHLITSAPKKDESKHGHPHDDATTLYKKHVHEDNIYHLGSKRECVIVDISKEGNIEIRFDQELVKKYGFKPDDGNKDEKKEKAVPFVGSRTSRIDKQPMG